MLYNSHNSYILATVQDSDCFPRRRWAFKLKLRFGLLTQGKRITIQNVQNVHIHAASRYLSFKLMDPFIKKPVCSWARRQIKHSNISSFKKQDTN